MRPTWVSISCGRGVRDKVGEFESIRDELGLSDHQAAFAGDDLVDLPLLKKVGLSMAPADACAEVLAVAGFVSRQGGGHGAVREMAEYILKTSGRWEEVTQDFL